MTDEYREKYLAFIDPSDEKRKLCFACAVLMIVMELRTGGKVTRYTPTIEEHVNTAPKCRACGNEIDNL